MISLGLYEEAARCTGCKQDLPDGIIKPVHAPVVSRSLHESIQGVDEHHANCDRVETSSMTVEVLAESARNDASIREEHHGKHDEYNGIADQHEIKSERPLPDLHERKLEPPEVNDAEEDEYRPAEVNEVNVLLPGGLQKRYRAAHQSGQADSEYHPDDDADMAEDLAAVDRQVWVGHPSVLPEGIYCVSGALERILPYALVYGLPVLIIGTWRICKADAEESV